MRFQGRKIAVIGLFGMTLPLLITTGCAGNGSPRRWYDEPGYAPDRSTIVRKPPLDSTNPKPVFLGGYAGANY